MAALKERLESLYRHLDEEGWHVHANTVAETISMVASLEKLFDNDGGIGSSCFDQSVRHHARTKAIKILRGDYGNSVS